MRSIYLFFAVVVIVLASVPLSFAQNYKIKQTTSMNGQSFSSTVYVKGTRKRTENSGIMGMGGDVADIEQCDLKRNVKVSDKKRLYFTEPFAADVAETPVRTAPLPAGTKSTKGGTVTVTTSIVDTGERKQMFGLTARHVKSTMTMQSSPDACSPQDTRIETDGWYIDLPQFSCPLSAPRNPYAQPSKHGCLDRTIVKNTGGGRLGFALSLTQMIRNGGENGMGFTQTTETVEFSKTVLDDALFDVPAGYALAGSSNDLYGRPDFSAITRSGQDDPDQMETPRPARANPAAKRPGVIRIGVLQPSNRTIETVSTVNLQTYLAGRLTSGKYEGVTVNSEAEARAIGCDYIVSSDISKMKQSTASKIGGLFGKVTSTDTSGSKSFDAQVDYKVASLQSGQQVLQSKAAAKFTGSADNAVENVLSIEATSIIAAAK
jgi:hypothetical protein